MKKFLSVITTVICVVLILTLAACEGGGQRRGSVCRYVFGTLRFDRLRYLSVFTVGVYEYYAV